VSQINITHYECLSAALVIQHAKQVYHVILQSLACLAPHFSMLSHKTAQFSGKKPTKHKNVQF